jgi:hypothetical protein
MLPLLLMTSALIPGLSTGDVFPGLKGEYLTGRTAVLPDAATGRIALLAFGFTYDSRFAVEAFIAPYRKEFGGNAEVTFFEIPMIGGMARLGKWFIDSGMRKGTPKQDHENVITVYGGVDPWKQRLGYKAPKDAYLVLLDRNGVVRWRYNGLFDEGAYARLSENVRDLLKR